MSSWSAKDNARDPKEGRDGHEVMPRVGEVGDGVVDLHDNRVIAQSRLRSRGF